MTSFSLSPKTMAFSAGGKKILVIGFLVGITWSLLSPLIVYLVPEPFVTLNRKIYDQKLSLFAKTQLNPNIVHVDIDDPAVKKYGTWPWDRALSARIVEALTNLGAKAIVLDIMYTAPGRTRQGDESLFTAIASSGRVVEAMAIYGRDSTETITDAEGATKRVLKAHDKAWQLDVPRGFNLLQVPVPRDSLLPLTPIIEGAREMGHINSTPDPDGIYRRVPLFIKCGDRLVPSLSLAALVTYLDATGKNTVVTRDGRIEIHHPNGVMEIPVDSHSNLLINWRPTWDSFDHYSALDILNQEADAARIDRYKGKIAVVSAASTGVTDMGPSSIEEQVLLSRLHSSAIDTILTGRFIHEVPPFPLVIALAVVISIVFLILAINIRVYHSVILYLALSALYAGSVMAAFAWASIEIPVTAPYFIFLPPAATCLAFRAVSTDKDRRMIRDTFGLYLSDEVAAEILKSPGGVNLTGEEREITVMVADLRGFTPLAGALKPPIVLEVINRYFERMIDIIMRCEGTIDEFTGDGVLVLFGAPRSMPDHAQRAILCALKMQDAMPQLNRENAALGLPQLKMGIGINSGPVIVGNIGSAMRRKYGAIGSAINVAFRVEAQTNRSDPEILVTQAVLDRIDGPLELGPSRTVGLKGVQGPFTLYPVLGV